MPVIDELEYSWKYSLQMIFSSDVPLELRVPHLLADPQETLLIEHLLCGCLEENTARLNSVLPASKAVILITLNLLVASHLLPPRLVT